MEPYRRGTYPIPLIESALKDIVLGKVIIPEFMGKKHKDITIDIDGVPVSIFGDRMKLFFTKGYDCVECGLKGHWFRIWYKPQETGYSLQLYGINSRGDEVLMTKDHILPKSKGGKNGIDNYQVMCLHCNQKKGSILSKKDAEKLRGTFPIPWVVNKTVDKRDQIGHFKVIDNLIFIKNVKTGQWVNTGNFFVSPNGK